VLRFRAELQRDGKTATGITVPPEVLDGLGGGKRPAVRVTINGHTYPSTIGTMNGVAKIPVSGAVRAAANINAGDVLEVEVETDHTSRTVTVPDDLAAALVGDPDSRAFFDGLSYSRTHAYVSWIEQAKKRETRQSRVTQTVALLAERRPQR
jgi:Bacteriocin-protection, YdeI or OmpD-Associated/Domain of unknown function (DUF1905)